MYIDHFSITFLLIALSLSVANIYLMFLVKKHLKSGLVVKSFDLLKKEVSLLNQKQTLHQSQTQFDAARLETLEKVLSAIITQGASFGSDDDGNDGTIH
jgi:hypothetical protein